MKEGVYGEVWTAIAYTNQDLSSQKIVWCLVSIRNEFMSELKKVRVGCYVV